tara:strand:- start:66 stop:1055 length:990 start_codon:yes stop_codon:yes gene_type:complete
MIDFLQGDVFDNIKKLDDNTIDCVVTSPPYWGLRDYGTASYEGGDPDCKHTITDGIVDNKNNKLIERPDRASDKKNCVRCGAKRIDKQLGLEPTYQEHIQNIVKLFRAMKPKLKNSATIWLNYGDSYNSNNGFCRNKGKYKREGRDGGSNDKKLIKDNIIKEKDLMMIPNRVAIALQESGWWIRSEIIWHKPNPMPESVRDRPTSCHEKIWLITKSKKYYYDADAIREPLVSSLANVKIKSNGKNKRNVWTVTTKPCKEAHFATFPKDLIEPCIKAGCPENGIVFDPFSGSGTTGIVAKLLNRKAILSELNPEYIKIAKIRINKEFGMF